MNTLTWLLIRLFCLLSRKNQECELLQLSTTPKPTASCRSRSSILNTKGVQAELLVAADLAKHGHTVAFPVSDAQPFDLLAVDKDTTLKVQVKMLFKSGRDRYATGNDLTKYKEGDFDLLAVVFPTDGEIRYLQFHEMNGKRRLSFTQE